MNTRLVIKVIGLVCLALGGFLLIPFAFSLWYRGPTTQTFLLISLISSTIGILSYFSQIRYQADMDIKTSIAVVCFSSVVAVLVGATPYYMCKALPSILDAIFESVSGFTGTGASVIVNLDQIDAALILWRSMTQWIGGLGILLLFATLSPFGSTSASLLYRHEPSASHKDMAFHAKEAATRLWPLYFFLSVLLVICLIRAGMTPFDALNQALTTISTGGFSIHTGKSGALEGSHIQVILSIFMLIGALNFAVLYRLIVQRDPRALISSELKWYLVILVVSAGLVFYSLYPHHQGNVASSVKQTFFLIASAASSTGSMQTRYDILTPLSQVIIILLVVMGGMSGSTSGGVKCIRLVTAVKQMLVHFTHVLHPSAVVTIKTNDQTIPSSVIDGIWAVLFMYFMVFSVASVILAAQGFDIVDAASVSFSSLSNFGPALGHLASELTYASLNEVSKITLAVCMFLGRLEFFLVLVIFTPSYWKR